MTLVDSRRVRSVVFVPPTIRIDELLPAVGGRLQAATSATAFSGASVDSRSVEPGNLFVALRGERADGHAHVAEAVRAGATAVLIDRPVELPGGLDAARVIVTDPLAGLQDLAAWWRSRHDVRVVGITGSTGKTIAKEMVADVLSRTLRTLRNAGNLNSESGLPMTLLRLEETHEAAVLEMSMYTVGEIARLAEIARPEVGVILAVHPTHLERAGSLERIEQAKGELAEALPAAGLAVLNADDERVARMAARTVATVRTFGLGQGADVRADEIRSHGLEGTTFLLRTPWGSRRMRSATPGRHLVPHALAAAAVAEWMGVPMEEVAAALEAGSRAAHRMERRDGHGGATLVDDTYNASPVSMRGALEFLAETEVPAGGRRIAVLGDMLELGPDEEELHRDIGRAAAAAADVTVTVGERGAWIAEAARSAGARVLEAMDEEQAAEIITRELAPGPSDLVLLKASRGIGLDRAVDRLAGDPT